MVTYKILYKDNFSLSEVSQIYEIEKSNFVHPWNEKDIIDSMLKGNYLFIIAVNEDEIVGHIGAYYVIDELNIVTVAVKKEAQNKNIGCTLINKLIDVCKSKKIKKVYLEVRKSNSKAIRLYEKASFKNDGVRKNFYDSPIEDGILMSITL